MATNRDQESCDVCKRFISTVTCNRCKKVLCHDHYQQHRQEIADDMRQVKVRCEDLESETTRYTQNIEEHALMQAIDDWMNDSIQKVQQAANKAKETLRDMLTNHVSQVEVKRRECHADITAAESAGDADEFKLQRWSAQVDEFKAELDRPALVGVFEDVMPLVYSICVTPSIPPYPARWNPQGESVAHGLSHPCGLRVDEDQTIYIADSDNHRILAWKVGAEQSEVVAGGKGQGAGLDQLNYPTDVIVDRESNTLLICDRDNQRVMRWPRRPQLSGTVFDSKADMVIKGIFCEGLTIDDEGALYVTDYKKHEVRRYDKGGDKKGIVVAGGHGEGAGLHQLNCPTYLFVDAQKTLYVSDTKNHRVMKWMSGAREGIVIAGGNGMGEKVTQLSDPKGVWVDGCRHVYVADAGNHRVMRWENGATEGTVIVGVHGRGKKANQLSLPDGLFLDRHGHLYIADWGNNRVQRFSLL